MPPSRSTRSVVVGFERGEQLHAPPRDDDAREPAERGQHDAFREQLSDETAPSGAHGEANRDLTASPGRADEKEIRDVRARNEQHEPDRA